MSTIAPCAKLKTPLALKISTKPSATREYITPAEVRANPDVIAAYLGVPTAADDRALKEAS